MISKVHAVRIAKQVGCCETYINRLQNDSHFIYGDGINYTYYFMSVTNSVANQILCNISNRTISTAWLEYLRPLYIRLRDEDSEIITGDILQDIFCKLLILSNYNNNNKI